MAADTIGRCPSCQGRMLDAMLRLSRKKPGPSGAATVEQRWDCETHGGQIFTASLRRR